MEREKRKRLEAAGWKVGTAQEFLGLDEREAAYVEMKVRLSEELHEVRMKQGLSQVELAKRLGSSQSRVAKMEASDASVSLDLLVKGLLATGVSREQIGKAIAKVPARRARRTTKGNAA